MSRYIPNAELAEIIEGQAQALAAKRGAPVVVSLEDADHDDLEETAVWLDAQIEGSSTDEPRNVDIHEVGNALIITNKELLGQWLVDHRTYDHVYRYRGYKDLDDTDYISWSDLEGAKTSDIDDPENWNELFYVPSALSYGDYDGSTAVERSNYDVFMEQWGGMEEDVEDPPEPEPRVVGIYEVSGSHGSQAIAIRLDTINEREMFEALGSLEDYPLLDDDAHTRREQEMFDEAWENYGESEFRSAVERALNVDIDTDQDLSPLYNVYHEAADEAGHYPYVEGGGNVVFDTENAAAEVTLDDLDVAGIEYEIEA